MFAEGLIEQKGAGGVVWGGSEALLWKRLLSTKGAQQVIFFSFFGGSLSVPTRRDGRRSPPCVCVSVCSCPRQLAAIGS